MIRIRLKNPTLGALCLAALALPATAQSYVVRPGFSFDPTEVVSHASVPYADLDLRSEAGVRTLLGRIEAAANAVCGGAAPRATAEATEKDAACRAAAVSGAVAKMRNPALARLAAAGPWTQERAAK